MKRAVETSSDNVVSSFSILERIELGETRSMGMFAAVYERSFSILERIELGETPHECATETAVKIFQYPRTDRIG